MSTGKDKPKGQDYQELIEEGIDELNAESNFDETGFSQERKEKKPASKGTKNLFLALTLAVLLNLGLMFYLRAGAPSTMTQTQADTELYQNLDSEDIPVEKVLSYIGKNGKGEQAQIPLPKDLEYEDLNGGRYYEESGER